MIMKIPGNHCTKQITQTIHARLYTPSYRSSLSSSLSITTPTQKQHPTTTTTPKQHLPQRHIPIHQWYSTTNNLHLSSSENEKGGGFFSSLRSKLTTPTTKPTAAPSPTPSSPTSSTTSSSSKPNELTEQYQKQFLAMAESPSWTLTDVSRQLDENLTAMTKGWKNLVPGVRNTNKGQVEALQQEKAIVDAAIEVLGSGGGVGSGSDGVGMEELKYMDRKDKLKIALASNVDPTTINSFVENFESVSIMHRVLRHRHQENLPLPQDEESARRMIQTDIHKVLTTRERKELQRQRQKKMMKRN